MSGLARVLGGVLVRRRVAAADRATAHAHSQVDPFVAGREALGAALAIRRDALDRVPVGAADGAGIEGGRRLMVGLRGDEAQPEPGVQKHLVAEDEELERRHT
jgi:hypothetical protein